MPSKLNAVELIEKWTPVTLPERAANQEHFIDSCRKLGQAVLGAYAAADPDGDWSEDWADVWTDTGAGFPLPANRELSERRKEIDQRVLGNLLRMNLERAKG